MFIEAEYFFPISLKDCFDSFSAEFDNKIIKGVIKEKEEARKEYEDNKQKGNLVAYSEIKKDTPDIMKIDIGNIPP